MRICPACGASNVNSANLCCECGVELNVGVPPAQEPDPSQPATVIESKPDLSGSKTTITEGDKDLSSGAQREHNPYATVYETLKRQQKKADILFVLDCTYSMQGELDAIRDAIVSFADTIETNRVRARVGLIVFRDRFYGEEHYALLFRGHPFTSDPKLFRQEISDLQAEGGGDEPESSLDGLMLALKQPFDPEANKVLVLITDAPPHIPDVETQTIEAVVKEIQVQEVDQLHMVIRTRQPDSQIYLKLLEGTRGLAFELGVGDDFRKRAEDFKRTLMALGKTITSMTI